jgi:hypothetical protein
MRAVLVAAAGVCVLGCASALGACPDKGMSGGTTPADLTKDCVQCITDAKVKTNSVPCCKLHNVAKCDE